MTSTGAVDWRIVRVGLTSLSLGPYTHHILARVKVKGAILLTGVCIGGVLIPFSEAAESVDGSAMHIV